jgi:hypothetical protein
MRRLADAERSAPDGAALGRIADGIDQDRETLSAMLRTEGIAPRRYKVALARAIEAVGLLKANGTIVRRSPLTSVLELEALRMGVTGKHALWSALRQTELSDRHDFTALMERAGRQLEELEHAHARRAGVILDPAPTPVTVAD